MPEQAGNKPDHSDDQDQADDRSADHDPSPQDLFSLPPLRPDPGRGMLPVLVSLVSLVSLGSGISLVSRSP